MSGGQLGSQVLGGFGLGPTGQITAYPLPLIGSWHLGAQRVGGDVDTLEGAGSAIIEIAAAGAAVVGQGGEGTAIIEIAGNSLALISVSGTGNAIIEVAASDVTVVDWVASGDAIIEIAASGVAQVFKVAEGSAVIEIAASGIAFTGASQGHGKVAGEFSGSTVRGRATSGVTAKILTSNIAGTFTSS